LTTFEIVGATGAIDNLILKITPPRVPRHLVTRPRLLANERFRDCPVVLVQAPAGFGKTSLLAQWRLEHLAHGAVVAWLSAQATDEPQRLVQGLALAFRTGAGRPTFGHTLFDAAALQGLEGITMWLAEVAETALNAVLIIDEADRLPPASRNALAYLLHNTQPNLCAIISARPDAQLGIDDLITYRQCAVVGAKLLRFQLDETLELARRQFGANFDPDAVARLHEWTEGWPLGLQLALSIMASGSNPRLEAAAIGTHGNLRDHFVDLLLANLDPSDLALLTHVSILDHLHPQLCSAVVKTLDAAERLDRMARTTPIIVASEESEWLRMHALVREELRRRFTALPREEQSRLHARAARWLADHGLIEAAATHALASGLHDEAYALAERSLYESLMIHGRQSIVQNWLSVLPADQLDSRPSLLLAAAWSLAVSERHEEASRLVARILALPGVDEALRCECALILGGAAVFADDPDRFAELHDPWAEEPPLRDPLLLQVHANRSAFRALLEGEPSLARLRQQRAPRDDRRQTLGYVSRWGEFIIGLTYFWEGQVLLAEQLLRPTLALAEADLGRRNPFTCMMAALLAATVWERDQPSEAAAILADRLDVLERSGLPETVLLAYRTMACIAGTEGAEHRALELLSAMHAAGTVRRLPRLCIASLADQVRLHARRFRGETCRDLCAQIDAMMADPKLPQGRLWHRSVSALHELAHGYAAIAARDWRGAHAPLARAATVAQELKQGRLRIEIMGLQAFVLGRSGERSEAMLREAVDLARTFGLQRVFTDAHPALGAWLDQIARTGDGPDFAGPTAVPARPSTRETPRPRTAASIALTPKEREVLELLARNLSNKEIGLAMQVGEETIKWHVKNLLAKLSAATRKQAVSRARILGFLTTEN
jgi:LuxR family maltose regulon positive regulatory protein